MFKRKIKKKRINALKKKKKALASVIGGVCSDPWARLKSHTHAHTDGGARESRAQNREEKKEPNQCWTSAYDRWQSRVLLLFSPFLSNSLSFPFCFLLSVSRPLRVLSPTIAWASANTSRAHLFGNEKPVAQPMRSLQELKGRRKKKRKERVVRGGV